jgi:hypothetical protein
MFEREMPHVAVPELTRSADIKLNERVPLRRKSKAIAWSVPDIAHHPDPAWRSRRAIYSARRLVFHRDVHLFEFPPMTQERFSKFVFSAILIAVTAYWLWFLFAHANQIFRH